MKLLELTLPTAAENVALDEALLLTAERANRPTETVRLWEPTETMVVIGRGSRVEDEVDVPKCTAEGVPILRRDSGGLAIVAGRGCLMYAVVLSVELDPALVAIDYAHRRVQQTLLKELSTIVPGVEHQGISDLVLAGRKFSGNSLRCKRTHLLYHGTLLFDMDLTLVARYLKHPHREPDYRDGRSHDDFLTQLPTDRETLRRAVIAAWNPTGPLQPWPRELTAQLVEKRYRQDTWNHRR